MKCYMCEHEMIPVKTDVDTGWGKYKITIHNFPAYRCPECGEKVFDGEETSALLKACKAFSDTMDNELLNQ